MQDKIQLITDKLFTEGIEKANMEADTMLQEAQKKADKILEDASQKAEQILNNALAESEELQKNITGEIQIASRHAFNMVRQNIADMITLETTDTWIKDVNHDVTLSKDIMIHAVHAFINTVPGESIRLTLPTTLNESVQQYLVKNIHDIFQNQVKIDVSHKFESGFRIGPSLKNYMISFTDKDFDNYIKRFLRPKTIELLFHDSAD
ncbi:MAG: hypothetical protein IPL63_06505 [Saprospiraceae bacterium]|nr:hypothetical protein [Saprospiraceae bacterium]MBK6564603.1 hypothetical protein [Saprospiraceae bacterium]MBK7523244.1 hypothetical protein [Saprospiraceae bacterium]MBK8371766.1 hypothetical protein [Saprospiraceae bacterium]MBK8547031.1 hypothetical protein [Saprospiraceae bacterium]